MTTNQKLAKVGLRDYNAMCTSTRFLIDIYKKEGFYLEEIGESIKEGLEEMERKHILASMVDYTNLNFGNERFYDILEKIKNGETEIAEKELNKTSEQIKREIDKIYFER